MASKDELMKQQRTLQRRPRANVPSYTMDVQGELKPEPTKPIEPAKEEAKAPEILPASPEIKTEKLVAEKTMVNEKPTKVSAVKKPAKIAADEIVKSVTVKLVDIDDADFLKYACKESGMNMQEFFWAIMDEDINSTAKIDPRDEEHTSYKTMPLNEIRTIPIPKTLKEKIGIEAGKHRLPETRYMAMIVHRARKKNPGWE